MRDNNGWLSNRLSQEVADEVAKDFRGIVNARVIRQAKAQQIDRIDTKLLGQRVRVFAPLERGCSRTKAMNEQQRLRITGTFYLIKKVTILPWIAALFAFQ